MIEKKVSSGFLKYNGFYYLKYIESSLVLFEYFHNKLIMSMTVA